MTTMHDLLRPFLHREVAVLVDAADADTQRHFRGYVAGLSRNAALIITDRGQRIVPPWTIDVIRTLDQPAGTEPMVVVSERARVVVDAHIEHQVEDLLANRNGGNHG